MDGGDDPRCARTGRDRRGEQGDDHERDQEREGHAGLAPGSEQERYDQERAELAGDPGCEDERPELPPQLARVSEIGINVPIAVVQIATPISSAESTKPISSSTKAN